MSNDRYYKGWRVYRDGLKITGYSRYGYFIQRVSPSIWLIWTGRPTEDGKITEGMRKHGSRFPTLTKARKWVKKAAHV